MTMSNLNTNKLLPQYVFSGAVVSGTTGSPTTSTLTSGTASWTVYTFTASGSITLSTGGPVDYLICGAGTKGPSNSQAGAGGGFIYATQQNLAAGTYTVTVGTTYGASSSFNSQTAGGGSGLTSGSPQSNGGVTIQSGTYSCPGGAGGRGVSLDGTNATDGGPPLYSDITGTSRPYCCGVPGASPQFYTSDYGAGGAAPSASTPSASQKGVVIIRVRTA